MNTQQIKSLPKPKSLPASYIMLSPSGSVSYVGPQATELCVIYTLSYAIELYVKSNGAIIPTRGMTITKMLSRAAQLTGRPYKRSQALQAISDLSAKVAALVKSLPIISQQ